MSRVQTHQRKKEREANEIQERDTNTTRGSALQRITSFREEEQEVTGVQALYPLIRVEEHDDQPGLHAVSDPSRWMSTCPLTEDSLR